MRVREVTEQPKVSREDLVRRALAEVRRLHRTAEDQNLRGTARFLLAISMHLKTSIEASELQGLEVECGRECEIRALMETSVAPRILDRAEQVLLNLKVSLRELEAPVQ